MKAEEARRLSDESYVVDLIIKAINELIEAEAKKGNSEIEFYLVRCIINAESYDSVRNRISLNLMERGFEIEWVGDTLFINW